MMRRIICINSVVIVLLAVFFLIYPPVRAALDLRDPALQHHGSPMSADKRKALGRGLSALLPPTPSQAPATQGPVSGTPARRDYFVAELGSSLAWVYREEGAWYIHGLFA